MTDGVQSAGLIPQRYRRRTGRKFTGEELRRKRIGRQPLIDVPEGLVVSRHLDFDRVQNRLVVERAADRVPGEPGRGRLPFRLPVGRDRFDDDDRLGVRSWA